MDWLAFMEKKRSVLANTGHIMDDEMFITHLLNSVTQAEYVKEIQCGATFGHTLACISPSRVQPPVACAYAIGKFS